MVKGKAFKRLILVVCSALFAGACTASSPVVENNAVSPLDEFFTTSAWHNADELEQLNAEMVQKREELIAQCMLDAGFNYIPDLNSRNGRATMDQAAPTDREWVAQYGYGIVSGHHAADLMEREDVDPNEEYLKTLTEAERTAFEIALNGPLDNPMPETPPGQLEIPREAMHEWILSLGCSGPATIASQEGNPLFIRDQDEFIPLFDAHSAMLRELERRPEFVTINQDWSNCMADAGFPWLPNVSAARVGILLEEAMLRMDMGTEPSPIRTELQEREIATALADIDCRESINLTQRRNALTFELETQFVNDHRAALEAYRAAQEQRS
jgi:hypothetical protein